eukprot:13723917-Alexandrium_andersonii.AAC.1
MPLVPFLVWEGPDVKVVCQEARDCGSPPHTDNPGAHQEAQSHHGEGAPLGYRSRPPVGSTQPPSNCVAYDKFLVEPGIRPEQGRREASDRERV